MENKVNIAEILKKCPIGTKLYSPIFGECKFVEVFDGIKVTDKANNIRHFYQDGRYNELGDCVLFPSKDQRDWNGFQIPFKDGDIIFGKNSYCYYLSIFKGYRDGYTFNYYVSYTSVGSFHINDYADSLNIRLATEEEKQKLFDTIKDNGYRWNSETKTLENLIVPKFKVGNIIKNEYTGVCNTIIKVCEEYYIVINLDEDEKRVIHFDVQHDWKLVSDEIEPKFKVGDRVVRKNGIGAPLLITKVVKEFYCSNNEDVAKFFKKTSELKFFRIADQDDYELVPNKFDISTLIPFESRVLVRDFEDQIWRPAIFGGYIDNREQYKFTVVGGLSYECLIPYEGNEHLRCKDDDCIEYYKTWEE